MREGHHIRYITITFAVVVLLHLTIGALNYVVDPLWFFGGNKIQGRNFPFDERTARLARFVTSDRDFDCYIFGASRVAMMSVDDFPGHDCFMVSFANATPRELLAFASYIKTRAKRLPQLVIVGIDDFMFLDFPDRVELPPPITENRTPYFWQYYFTLDIARWSVETLLDISPKPRYYDGNLDGDIRDDAEQLPILELDLEPDFEFKMNLDRVAQYARFRQLFPEATRLVAYATPVAAERISDYQEAGALSIYLEALHDIAAYFDEVYDFSIPSAVTINPELTYDGSHYEPCVSDRIAMAINHRDAGFGVVVSGKSEAELAALYERRLKLYIGDQQSPRPMQTGPWEAADNVWTASIPRACQDILGSTARREAQ